MVPSIELWYEITVASKLIAVLISVESISTFLVLVWRFDVACHQISCLLDWHCWGSRYFHLHDFLLLFNELFDFALIHFWSWRKGLSFQIVSIESSHWELFALEKFQFGLSCVVATMFLLIWNDISNKRGNMDTNHRKNGEFIQHYWFGFVNHLCLLTCSFMEGVNMLKRRTPF